MRKAKPKKPSKATPPARVLRTNTEIRGWLLGLERRGQESELARLAETEQWARELQGAAAEPLRALQPGVGVKRPSGQRSLVFRRPVAGRLQGADYLHRLSSRILVQIPPGRWALQELQQPDLPRGRRSELRAIANAALLEVEQLRARGTAYLQRPALEQARKLSAGRRPGSYGPLRRLVQAYLDGAPQAGFIQVWDHLHTLADQEDETIHEVLDGTAGCHPGDHVHWKDQQGREHDTTAARVRNLVSEILRSKAPRR